MANSKHIILLYTRRVRILLPSSPSIILSISYDTNRGEIDDRCNGVFLRDATIGTPESICKVPREEARFNWCGGDNNGVFRDSGPQFFDEDSCGFQIEIDGELYTPEKLDPADSKNACADTCISSSIAGFFLYQLPASCQ